MILIIVNYYRMIRESRKYFKLGRGIDFKAVDVKIGDLED